MLLPNLAGVNLSVPHFSQKRSVSRLLSSSPLFEQAIEVAHITTVTLEDGCQGRSHILSQPCVRTVQRLNWLRVSHLCFARHSHNRLEPFKATAPVPSFPWHSISEVHDLDKMLSM